MERKDRTVFVGVRIPEGLVNKIDSDVDSTGDFSSRSDFILYAIRKLLNERKESTKDT